MDKKVNLLLHSSNQDSFRGIGVYTRELRKQLEKHPSINLVNSIKKADIIHYPNFHLFNKIKIKHLRKTIFTIHDLTPLDFPHLFPLGIKSKINWLHNNFNLKKSLHIITDSIASKNQIIKFTSISQSKITPIYLAPPTSLNLKPTKKLKDTYALYVGDINPNKNIRKIVIACLTNNIKLYLAGKSATAKLNKKARKHPELQDLVWLKKQKKLHPTKIKLLGFVSNQKLSQLYQSATVCLQPSLSEGFGLPVLEALRLGCPVITSKTSSLPEVGGKSCFYVNPTDQEEINKQLIRGINLSPERRKKIIKAGKTHAKIFSWEKTAQQTVKLYKSLL